MDLKFLGYLRLRIWQILIHLLYRQMILIICLIAEMKKNLTVFGLFRELKVYVIGLVVWKPSIGLAVECGRLMTQ